LAVSVAAAVLWPLSALLTAAQMNVLEAEHAGGLLAALVLGLLACRGPARLAASPAGRLWTLAVFLAAALALSPVFLRAPTARGVVHVDWLTMLAAGAPVVFAVVLWLAWRAGAGPREPCSRFEQFVASAGVRWNLAALSVLVAFAGLALSGQPLSALVPRVVCAAVLLLSLPALLALSGRPAGQWALQVSVAVALAGCAGAGLVRYAQQLESARTVERLLVEDRPDEATAVFQQAVARDAVLQAQAPMLALERHWALYHERKGAFEPSLIHWRRIADAQGVDATQTLPVRRVLSRMGDSLNEWRHLLYQGFPAVGDPEVAPGIMALADSPAGDVRARVLAALLAWEQRQPEPEIKRRLALVRERCANEVNACNLLKRLGETVPDDNLWLPAELIVGTRLTSQSLTGSVDELGEVDTLVVLNPGRWEMSVHARGTPLQEEWPILGVEFDGQEVGRSQVTRSDTHEVPFTFTVNRGNIYRVKLRMINVMEDLVHGRVARRGMAIAGMSFRRAKGE
jgi:hypothetical protein